MSEKLSEREKWIALKFWCVGGGDLVRDDDIFARLVEEAGSPGNPALIPADPRDARIAELEGEVGRLNGVMDDLFWALSEVDTFGDDDNAPDRWELAAHVAYVNGREEPNENDIREGLILCIRDARCPDTNLSEGGPA